MSKKEWIRAIKYTVIVCLLIAAVGYGFAAYKVAVSRGDLMGSQMQDAIEKEQQIPHEGIIEGIFNAFTRTLTQVVHNAFQPATKPQAQQETPAQEQQQLQPEPVEQQQPAAAQEEQKPEAVQDYYSDVPQRQQQQGQSAGGNQ